MSASSRTGGSASGVIVFLSAVLLNCSASPTSTSTRASVESPSAAPSEPMWPKPPGLGCPATAVDVGDLCAVCSGRSRTACAELCSSGTANACTLLGIFVEYGLFGTADFREARQLFERGCALGSGEGCLGVARLLMVGRGGKKDERRAVEMFDELCRAGRAHACTLGAEAYLSAKGQPRDVRRGLAMLERGCTYGDREACRIAADPRAVTEIDVAVRVAREREARCLQGDLPVEACQLETPSRNRDETPDDQRGHD